MNGYIIVQCILNMLTHIYIIICKHYLYTDVKKINIQEKIKYEDRRLQKGLLIFKTILLVEQQNV